MSKLTAVIIGAEHAQGLSKKDNKPYNFANVYYLKQRKAWSNDKGASQVVGAEQASIEMNPSPALLEQFKTIEAQLPCEVELHLDINPENPQRNWVVDFQIL